MMSKLLEEAVIDAEALKEAALKNAESAIIEKYAAEVKDAVETILEQEMLPPEDEMAMMQAAGGAPPIMGMEPPIPMELAQGEEGTLDQIAPSFGDGETMCPCPDDGEEVEIEINFDVLGDQMQDEPSMMGDAISREEELAPELAMMGEALDEEINIDEESLRDVLDEKMTVDIHQVTQDWAGTPVAEQMEEQEAFLASLSDENYEDPVSEELEKKNEGLQKNITNINKENKSLKEEVNSFVEENTKLKEMVYQLRGALEEVNLSNAKLLYTNRVLDSISLNERQKNKIVDSIAKADSVEAAKVIYETLQSTVGSVAIKRTPKSLSEVVQKSSSTILPRKEVQKSVSNHISDRWKTLAGLGNKI